MKVFYLPMTIKSVNFDLENLPACGQMYMLEIYTVTQHFNCNESTDLRR